MHVIFTRLIFSLVLVTNNCRCSSGPFEVRVALGCLSYKPVVVSYGMRFPRCKSQVGFGHLWVVELWVVMSASAQCSCVGGAEGKGIVS
jgi:hypothetical protein